MTAIEDPARFLEALLRIPSLSGDEAKASEWLVGRMGALGFTRACVDEAGNAVGEMGEGPCEIVLLGHIDTVSGEVPVRIEGGKLYGRGAVDAKGPLAAFALATAALGPRPGWKVIVCGAVEEEAATSKGARHVVRRPAPEACVIGEPSSWRKICVGYKGRLLLDYVLDHPVAHSAGRESSACEIAVDFWNAVWRHADRANAGRERLFDQLTPSLRSMRSSTNGLVETVRMSIGFRLPVGLAASTLREELAPLAGEASLAFHGDEEGFRAERNNALVRAFLAAIRGAGGEPAFTVKTGTSDMNVVGPRWNCPILAYGPGDSSLDHTPDEHIEIAELEASIRILRDALDARMRDPCA